MKPELKNLHKSRMGQAKFISTLLAVLPFVRAIILNGSLAQGKISRSSDIDLLVIAEKGRIFTARAFCLFLVWISGRKRGSNEQKPHEGRFCLNYFLTSDFLIIPHNREENINKYCAENYSQSVLLAGDEELFNKFMQKNCLWMRKYLVNTSTPLRQNYEGQADFLHRINTEGIVNAGRSHRSNLKRDFEKMLGGKFGDNLEQWLKKMQLKRINCDPRTAKHPDLIIANDREMRFHPPKERPNYGIMNQE